MQKFWAFSANPRVGLDNIFAQAEIADSFSKLYDGEKEIGNIARPENLEYYGTKDVSDAFIEQGLGQEKGSSVLVFAQPYHMYRCVKTLEKSLRNANRDTKVLAADCSNVPFNEKSSK